MFKNMHFQSNKLLLLVLLIGIFGSVTVALVAPAASAANGSGRIAAAKPAPTPTKPKRKKPSPTGKAVVRSTAVTTKPNSTLAGSWGGTDGELRFEKADIAVKLPCAFGKIEGPLKLDEQGNFSQAGVYTRQGRGPMRAEPGTADAPAIYAGRVAGDTLTFTVTLLDTKIQIGEFTVRRGQPTKLEDCPMM